MSLCVCDNVVLTFIDVCFLFFSPCTISLLICPVSTRTKKGIYCFLTCFSLLTCMYTMFLSFKSCHGFQVMPRLFTDTSIKLLCGFGLFTPSTPLPLPPPSPPPPPPLLVTYGASAFIHFCSHSCLSCSSFPCSSSSSFFSCSCSCSSLSTAALVSHLPLLVLLLLFPLMLMMYLPFQNSS